VPCYDKVERIVSAIEGGGVRDAEFDLLARLFGFPAGSIDHLWRQIDPGHCVT